MDNWGGETLLHRQEIQREKKGSGSEDSWKSRTAVGRVPGSLTDEVESVV